MPLSPKALVGLGLCLSSMLLAQTRQYKWQHVSSTTGELPVPNSGGQQTSCTVFDIDKDGYKDIVITERTQTPTVIWIRHTAQGWTKQPIETGYVRPEAGSEAFDIDGDGDLDFMTGGDGTSNHIWWWENPYPHFDPQKGWTRRLIKDFGGNKQHDQMFGDFDGDNRPELVFWNQKECKLYLADIPGNVRGAKSWACSEIYSWTEFGEMQQRGWYPSFKAINEHEGFAKADIDGDGKLDIIGGGRWFKHITGTQFQENIIDAGYAFSRAGVGQLVEGGRPEVVLVVGDGIAPLMMYEWIHGTWVGKEIIKEIDGGHSLALLDFDGDGHLDIWNAEMRLGDTNPDAKNQVLFGDGQGHFVPMLISSGICLHESKVVDLDGDGDYDIVGKPYSWNAPRLDIWLNEGQR